MKRIELFEEGFFLTFIIKEEKAYIAKASLTAPFSASIPELAALPLAADEYVFSGYEDTGNQTGRAVTLLFDRPDDGTKAEVRFQFYKGLGKMSITRVFYGEAVPDAVSFYKVLENRLDGVEYSVCEDGSESFILAHDLIEKEASADDTCS